VRQLGGAFSLNWRKEGLLADFTLPLAKLVH
jgi:hypothetical protein